MSDTQRPVPSVTAAQQVLLRAALRVVAGEYEDPYADSDAEAEYAAEQLALAARALTRAVDALPPERRPVGWDKEGR